MADLDQVTPPLPVSTVNTLAALRAVPSGSLVDGQTALVLKPWAAMFVWSSASLGPDQPEFGILLPDDRIVANPGRWVYSEAMLLTPNGQLHVPTSGLPATEDDGAVFVSDGTGGLVNGSLYYRRLNNGPSVRLDAQGSAELDAGDTGAGAFAVDFTAQRLVRARLTGNCTFSFTFPSVGNYNLRLVQDGVGGRTPVFPASAWSMSGQIAIAGAANAETQIALVWTGSRAIVTSVPNILGSAVAVLV